MGEIEKLTAMVAQLAEDRILMSQENSKLVAALNAQVAAAAQQQQPGTPAVSRAEKVAKLSLALRKSHKVKDFKDGADANVCEWVKRFDQEVGSLQKMSGINDAPAREE